MISEQFQNGWQHAAPSITIENQELFIECNIYSELNLNYLHIVQLISSYPFRSLPFIMSQLIALTNLSVQLGKATKKNRLNRQIRQI